MEHCGPQFLDIDVQAEEFTEDMMKIFSCIRPSWRKDDIVYEDMSGGYTNSMMRCRLRSDPDWADAIVVRIYGQLYDKFASRSQELKAMQLAQTVGTFPKLLVIFHNGVAYEYFEGRTLDGPDLGDAKVIRCIAGKLAQFKAVDPTHRMLLEHDGREGRFDMTFKWEQKIRGDLEGVPDRFRDAERQAIFESVGLDRSTLHEELNVMHRKLRDLSLPLCLNHGDCHVNNIVYNDDKDDAILVDYETSEYMYEYIDLAKLLSVSPIWKAVGFMSPDSPDINADVKSQWVRSYLQRKCELQGHDFDKLPEAFVEKAEIEFALAELYYTLAWCVFSIQTAYFPVFGLKILSTLPEFRTLWLRRKQRLPELEETYRRLKQLCEDIDQ